jgi:hypothetical protein
MENPVKTIACQMAAAVLLAASVQSTPATGQNTAPQVPEYITLRVATSLSIDPPLPGLSADAACSRKFAIGVRDGGSPRRFSSGFTTIAASKRGAPAKIFAGLPFTLDALQTDTRLELESPIELLILGDGASLVWADKLPDPSASKNHFDYENDYPRGLLATGTRIMDWGLERRYRGGNFTLVERYLSGPRVLAQLRGESLIITSSGVPCICDEQGFPIASVPNAAGVVWRFEKQGVRISVAGKLLEAKTPGATIEFRMDGPALKGVVEVEH